MSEIPDVPCAHADISYFVTAAGNEVEEVELPRSDLTLCTWSTV